MSHLSYCHFLERKKCHKPKKMFKFKVFSLFVTTVLFCVPVLAFAETEIAQDSTEIVKAKVLEIKEEYQENIPGMLVSATNQVLSVELLSGSQKGNIIEIQNDYVSVDVGQKIYINHTVLAMDDMEYFTLYDINRTKPLVGFGILFVAVILAFGGKQGLRGLASLIGSLALIFYILIPGLLNGFDPVMLSIGVASLIIVIGSYVTHGFNRTTTTAVIGMIITVIISGILSFLAVRMTHLTGYADENAMYLSFNIAGGVDLAGLLLGGILIGLLGTLYDASISQAIAVEEIYDTDPSLSKKAVYKKVLRIGREHIGALVDTLAIAYVGAALPLILLYAVSDVSFGIIINREIFATEIIRILVGSIGVILAVPITTAIATMMLVKKGGSESSIKKTGHSHFHSHH